MISRIIEEMDTAHWLTEFIPKKLSLQEYGFSFLPAFSSIRIEGVSKEGNRKFVQLNFCKDRLQLLIQFGAVDNLSERTYLFMDRDRGLSFFFP